MIAPKIPKGQLGLVTERANIELVSGSLKQRYNELELSEGLFSLLFDGNEFTDDMFVSVRPMGSSLFKQFNIYKVKSVEWENTSQTVRLFNVSRFDKYNDQVTLTSCEIKSVDPGTVPILESIYVKIPDRIYDILSKEPQDRIRRQFLTKYVRDGVLNTGDSIRALNGTVILTEPITQGFFRSNTEVIFIKQESKSQLRSSEEIQLANLNLNVFGHEPNEMSEPFPVKALTSRVYLNNLPSEWSEEDDELFLFMRTNDLLKSNLNIFNGDTVKLVLESDEEILVKLFTFLEPTTSAPGFIYMSPLLAINLGLAKDSKLRIAKYKDNNALISESLPVANQVTISRVASSISMDKVYQQHFFSNLKFFFNRRLKCLRVGDFIPVAIDTILSKTMFDSGSTDDTIPLGSPDAVAWFQIVVINEGSTKLPTGQYLVDASKTKLISSGVEYIRLPANEIYDWHSYLELSPIFKYGNSENDFSYYQELKRVLNTSIETKHNTTILLNSFTRGAGKSTLITDACLELGLNLIEIDCNEIINPGQELKTIGILTGKIDKILNGTPVEGSSGVSVIYLKYIENLCVEKNVNDQNSSIYSSLSLKVVSTLNSYLKKYPSNLIVTFGCNDLDKLSHQVQLMIKFKIDVTIPSERERGEIFKYLFNSVLNANTNSQFTFDIRSDINFPSLALQSAGLNPLDLVSIVNSSKKFAIKRLRKVAKEQGLQFSDLVNNGDGGQICITPQDCATAINDARNQFSDSIGAPKIPDVKWEDIGGLDLVKDEILDTIDMPLKYPELFNNGLKKRSGILFYGPPGTGKTLLAKAIATNFSLNFFSVKGPELLNMYIGESEANVRKVFQKARDAKPCVIFFDELDSVAPKRGNQGDSGGVMDRIVSQLLAELDGMSNGDGDGVFVVGATNRPDLLDEALLRPGRFDKMLYLGISDTNEKQFKILEALTRKFTLDVSVDLEKVAAECPFNLTGADFYALCSDSMLNAMTRVSGEVDAKVNAYNLKLELENKEAVPIRWWFDNVATNEDVQVVVKLEDFKKALAELNPSVLNEELNHYLRIRENFEGGKELAQAAAAAAE